MTDATFERLDEQTAVGPEAVLLCGYDETAAALVGDLLARIGLLGHRVLRCTPSMVARTLEEALEGNGPDEPAPADALPRAVVLSGLTGGGIHAFLAAFGETGLPRPIFASATPVSLGFPVKDLLRDLLAEDRAARGRGR